MVLLYFLSSVCVHLIIVIIPGSYQILNFFVDSKDHIIKHLYLSWFVRHVMYPFLIPENKTLILPLCFFVVIAQNQSSLRPIGLLIG